MAKDGDHVYKWDLLETWKTQKAMVIPIDGTEYERWHSSLTPGTPVVVIEYGNHAIVIDVVPLKDDGGYLDIEVMGFTDGVLDPTSEATGMSRDYSWSDPIEYPHFSITVGRPRKGDDK